MKKSDIEEKNVLSRWWFAWIERENRMDFNYKYTMPSQGIVPTSEKASDYDGMGGFMLFLGSPNTVYNLNDAGQFLWGNAMKKLGFDYSKAKLGSQANEGFGDAKADQRAKKRDSITMRKPVILVPDHFRDCH